MFHISWGKVLWYSFLSIAAFQFIGWWAPALVILTSFEIKIST